MAQDTPARPEAEGAPPDSIADENILRGVMSAVAAMTESVLSGRTIPTSAAMRSSAATPLDSLLVQANVIRQLAVIASGQPQEA